jgi:DNA-binding transcriptional LysR family regulator
MVHGCLLVRRSPSAAGGRGARLVHGGRERAWLHAVSNLQAGRGIGENDGAHARDPRAQGSGSYPCRRSAAPRVPGALARLARDQPDIPVALREGTSAVLTRALRAGTLEVEIIAEGPLQIAVGASHRLAGRSRVPAAELTGERWVVARSEGEERLLGVWPGFAGRPNAPYVVRDWLTKLQLVASGTAITTIPDVLVPALPPDVHAVRVDDIGTERRRLLLVRIPGVARPEADMDRVLSRGND